jgi:putative hydrolase of the HAD superfamily
VGGARASVRQLTPVGEGGFLVWDFDGTLATRPGNWTAALCEVVNRERPDLGITLDLIRPHLQSGFRWHTPEIVRSACSEDEWCGAKR